MHARLETLTVVIAVWAAAAGAVAAQTPAQTPAQTTAATSPDPQARVLALVQAGKCGEAHDVAVQTQLDSLAEQITQMCGYKASGGADRKGGGGGHHGGGGGGRRGGGAQAGGAPTG